MQCDMAGLEEYERFAYFCANTNWKECKLQNVFFFAFLSDRYLEDEEDQLDNIPRFHPTFKSPLEPQHYQFINSERDLTLPLTKHKNVQPIYESPEEGEYLH